MPMRTILALLSIWLALPASGQTLTYCITDPAIGTTSAATGFREFLNGSTTETTPSIGLPPLGTSGTQPCRRVTRTVTAGTYTVAVKGTNAQGDSPLSQPLTVVAQAPVPPPPPAPSPPGAIPNQPTFTSIDSSTATVNVQVSWLAATNAASYHYSSGVNTGTWAGATGTTTTRTATLPNVPRGTRVWACIIAMNTAGAQSAPSCNGYDVPLATTPQLPPLPAPTGGAIDPQTYRVATVLSATGYVWTANGGPFATTTTPSVLVLWAAGPPSIPVTIAVRGVRSTDPAGTPPAPTFTFPPMCFNVAGCAP